MEAMELIFKGVADEALREYARRRIGKLDRYLPAVQDAVVEVRRENTRAAQQRYVVEVTMTVRGAVLRAEERAADPRVAVDEVADALGRQVRRHKDKLYRSGRSAHAARHAEESERAPGPEDMLPPEEEEEVLPGRVVRVKRFDIKPMTVEEAAEQMELLGHTFFLFFDAAERRYALLYRRRDGDYGLIIPGGP
jgi:ribosomal subunit interface protein